MELSPSERRRRRSAKLACRRSGAGWRVARSWHERRRGTRPRQPGQPGPRQGKYWPRGCPATAEPDARPAVAGVLSAVLLIGTADRLMPAIRAGLHHGTRGLWVATSEDMRAVRLQLEWQVRVRRGPCRAGLGPVLRQAARWHPPWHVGRRAVHRRLRDRVPAAGSDLWILLLAALVAAALGLYWSSHGLVRNYLRQRRSSAA